MSQQYTAKQNKTLEAYGFENPIVPVKPKDSIFSIDYHHKILKNLSTLRDCSIVRGNLIVVVEMLGNRDLLLLSKHYDEYLICIHENFNSSGLQMKIFLGKEE